MAMTRFSVVLHYNGRAKSGIGKFDRGVWKIIRLGKQVKKDYFPPH